MDRDIKDEVVTAFQKIDAQVKKFRADFEARRNDLISEATKKAKADNYTGSLWLWWYVDGMHMRISISRSRPALDSSMTGASIQEIQHVADNVQRELPPVTVS